MSLFITSEQVFVFRNLELTLTNYTKERIYLKYITAETSEGTKDYMDLGKAFNVESNNSKTVPMVSASRFNENWTRFKICVGNVCSLEIEMGSSNISLVKVGDYKFRVEVKPEKINNIYGSNLWGTLNL